MGAAPGSLATPRRPTDFDDLVDELRRTTSLKIWRLGTVARRNALPPPYRSQLQMIEILVDAIQRRRVVTFVYDGLIRHVEPHAFGMSSADKPLLRGYQIAGDSSSKLPAWKLFDMNKADGLTLSDVSFIQAREGYKPGDRAMVRMIAELELAA